MTVGQENEISVSWPSYTSGNDPDAGKLRGFALPDSQNYLENQAYHRNPKPAAKT
ncbi:hypothetical protein LBYZC6_12390 [Lacrimispora brassicae]